MFGLFKKKKNEEELYLEDLERRRREAQAPDDTGFQMTVEDVFAISGRGTVVTGSESGRARSRRHGSEGSRPFAGPSGQRRRDRRWACSSGRSGGSRWSRGTF